jgi:predicted glycosyltransferase
MQSTDRRGRKIWIDLDNSPHVPFFSPIVEELRNEGCLVVLTARDAYQVCDLADLYGLSYLRIGRHHGKNKFLKAAGTIQRSLMLLDFARKEKPDLALSHGSRAQLLTSTMLGIPSILMLDYEFCARVPFVKPTWLMAPEVIPACAMRRDEREIMRYPGLKEDVYVGRFRPDPLFRTQLGLKEQDVMVTLRPPATEAHYHNPASETLLKAVVELLAESPAAKIIVVPRNGRQGESIRGTWPALFQNGKFTIPSTAVDGLNMIWQSDLVISGGGTMNREAAALGVPVYSIFRGQIGAIDNDLAHSGRLVLLETVDDVRRKLIVKRCERSADHMPAAPSALNTVVANILSALNSRAPSPVRPRGNKAAASGVR